MSARMPKRKMRKPTVKKKWKNRKFTEAVDREENMAYIEELGVPFDEHIQRMLEAMQGVAEELGVAGEATRED